MKARTPLSLLLTASLFTFTLAGCGQSASPDVAEQTEATASEQTESPAEDEAAEDVDDETADVTADEPEEEAETEADAESEVAAQGEAPDEEVGTVEGITVMSSELSLPAEGDMINGPAGDDTVLLAVNGMLKEGSSFNISFDASGILLFDVTMDVASARTATAKLEVWKGQDQLVSHTDDAVALEAGETTINTIINTGEGEPCSGSYTVRLYIDGTLIDSFTATV